MLATIPVYAVMAEDLGERGAEYIALKLLKERIFQSAVEVTHHTSNTASSRSSSLTFIAALAVGVTIGFVLSKLNK